MTVEAIQFSNRLASKRVFSVCRIAFCDLSLTAVANLREQHTACINVALHCLCSKVKLQDNA